MGGVSEGRGRGLEEGGRRRRVDEEKEWRGEGGERRGRASDVGEAGGRWYSLSVQVSG